MSTDACWKAEVSIEENAVQQTVAIVRWTFHRTQSLHYILFATPFSLKWARSRTILSLRYHFIANGLQASYALITRCARVCIYNLQSLACATERLKWHTENSCKTSCTYCDESSKITSNGSRKRVAEQIDVLFLMLFLILLIAPVQDTHCSLNVNSYILDRMSGTSGSFSC